MKKFVISAIAMILAVQAVFAWTHLDHLDSSQKLGGYVNSFHELTVSGFMYDEENSGKGLNFDIHDTDNNFRFLIAPTQTPKSVPGLLIGTFSLVSSSSSYRLTISHDKLVNQSDGNIEYEYELCLNYQIQRGNSLIDHTSYCLSGDGLSAGEKVVIDFNEVNGVVMMYNAGVYFRLCSEVRDSGIYYSDITFTLETSV